MLGQSKMQSVHRGHPRYLAKTETSVASPEQRALFTWVVKSFQQLDETRLVSDVFSFYDANWRLLLYPRFPESRPPSIGIFVDVAVCSLVFTVLNVPSFCRMPSFSRRVGASMWPSL